MFSLEYLQRFTEFGRSIGVRLLELNYYREKKDKRETKLVFRIYSA